MDFNEEEEVLISLRNNMENSDEEEEESNENGHTIIRHSPPYPYQPSSSSSSIKVSLPWFDLRVFYVRVSKCVINDDDSTPEYLTLNHVPLNRDTLLEANGVRTSIYSDGVSTLLKRDRLDRRSEEVTFVSTDSIRMTASVRFEVFHKDVMVLSGTFELCHSNDPKNQSNWTMNCDPDHILTADGFLKGNRNNNNKYMSSPAIEVYVAGCFSGSPIIFTKTLQLSHRRKQLRKGMLESIPEYEATQSQTDDSSSLANLQSRHDPDYKPNEENFCSGYPVMEYLEGEDGELTWFNAGVRVGVGIGLSVCLGVGIGVGLMVRTYQGTTRNFLRRLL